VQGWGLSILLHILIGVPFLGVLVLLAPMPPEALVMPFRWDVSIVSAAPPAVVTAVVANSVAPPPTSTPGDQLPTKGDSQTSDPGSEETFLLKEPSVAHPTATGRGGEGRDQSHRELSESHITKIDWSSVPFADQGDPEPPPPDVPSRMERSLSIRATLAKPIVRQRPQPADRLVRMRSILPDYGWLSKALRDTIERTKRYPSVARANRWQGQVLVQFSVRQDGHLVDPRVVESSGYVVLDQAALETVRAASPVGLRHRLERPMVVVSLPLTYQLE
jgi:TonB family protein